MGENIKKMKAFDGDLWKAMKGKDEEKFAQLIGPYLLERTDVKVIIDFPFCAACFWGSVENMIWFVDACKRKFNATEIIARSTDNYHTKNHTRVGSTQEAEQYFYSHLGHCSYGDEELLTIGVDGINLSWEL